MACKIAKLPETAARMTWRPAGSSSTTRPASGSHTAATLDETEFAHKLAEFEQLRHSDIAQAQRAGFEEGMRRGRDEAASEVAAASRQLAENLRQLDALKKRMRNEAEGEVVRLALAVARRILYRELTIDPESIRGIVHAALRSLEHRDLMKVRVASESVDVVRSVFAEAPAQATIEVVPDSRMGRGDIVFETSAGQLDASIDTQLQEIQRGFADRLRG